MKVYVKAAKQPRWKLLYEYKDIIDEAVAIAVQKYVDSNPSVTSIDYDSVEVLKAESANYARLKLIGHWNMNYDLPTANIKDEALITAKKDGETFQFTELPEFRIKRAGYEALEDEDSAEVVANYLYMDKYYADLIDTRIKNKGVITQDDYHYLWDKYDM